MFLGPGVRAGWAGAAIGAGRAVAGEAAQRVGEVRVHQPGTPGPESSDSAGRLDGAPDFGSCRSCCATSCGMLPGSLRSASPWREPSRGTSRVRPRDRGRVLAPAPEARRQAPGRRATGPVGWARAREVGPDLGECSGASAPFPIPSSDSSSDSSSICGAISGLVPNRSPTVPNRYGRGSGQDRLYCRSRTEPMADVGGASFGNLGR